MRARIQKVLSENGIVSRRSAEKLIEQGRVRVNGRPAKIGMQIDPGKDLVDIDSKRVFLRKKNEKYYIMLHKPRGYVTTMDDEFDRKCITDLVGDINARVYPVGRLDKDSEGILLLSNDGNFVNSISHPSREITKVYRVTVRPSVTDDQLVRLADGIVIDGKKTLPATVRVLVDEPNRVVIEMGIKEGRNRQIRKMCEILGLEVARLKRISIGPLKLGMLKVGEHRELKPFELIAIRNAIGKGGVNTTTKNGSNYRR